MSDDDVNNYNKIKTDLDKLRLLVEQSELWIFKKKENHKESSDENPNTSNSQTSAQSNTSKDNTPKTLITTKLSHAFGENEPVGDPFVLQELDNGPELDHSAILKYKELYKILFSMIKLCVYETHLPNGTIKKSLAVMTNDY